jgi:amino acid transporter
MILTAATIANPTYSVQIYHVYLVLLALLVLEGCLTMNSTKFTANLNKIGAIANLVVVVIFIVWMPVGSINRPKVNSNSHVWTGIVNGTEWPSGFAFMMGFLSVIWTIVGFRNLYRLQNGETTNSQQAGYDAPFHLSEECSNANIASPRAIVMTAQLGLYLGWACILVIA